MDGPPRKGPGLSYYNFNKIKENPTGISNSVSSKGGLNSELNPEEKVNVLDFHRDSCLLREDRQT